MPRDSLAFFLKQAKFTSKVRNGQATFFRQIRDITKHDHSKIYTDCHSIIFLSISNLARAQTYYLRSTDGKTDSIHLIPDYVNNRLEISCLKDKKYIDDFTGIKEKVDILDGKFLKLTYSIRGGSGIHLRRTVLFSVYNHKLYESLHVTSLSSYELSTVIIKKLTH